METREFTVWKNPDQFFWNIEISKIILKQHFDKKKLQTRVSSEMKKPLRNNFASFLLPFSKRLRNKKDNFREILHFFVKVFFCWKPYYKQML